MKKDDNNKDEIVVDDKRYGSILHLDENPYFETVVDAKVMAQEYEDLKSNNYIESPEDLAKPSEEEPKEIAPLSNDKSIDLPTNSDETKLAESSEIDESSEEANSEETDSEEVDTKEEVKPEVAKTEVDKPEEADSEEELVDISDVPDFNAVNNYFMAIAKFKLDLNEALELDINADEDKQVAPSSDELTEQQEMYTLVKNNLRMVDLRLSDLEKLIIQSLQLDLMIIFMTVLLMSLLFFKVYFCDKRKSVILVSRKHAKESSPAVKKN